MKRKEGTLKKALRSGIILFAAMLFFAGIITFTYSWENKQYAVNSLFGTKDRPVFVELTKLDKDTKEPLEGVDFLLFRQDGTQVNSTYTTDENGKISLKLDSGKYYFEEISPLNGYTYDKDKDGNDIKKYHFTVFDIGRDITITAYNRKVIGNLIISKEIINEDNLPLTDIQRQTAFAFTVTFSEGSSYNYSIDDEKFNIKSGEKIYLFSGQSAIFYDIPYGTLYDVTEEPVEGYEISVSSHRGNITDVISHAEFINRCDLNYMGKITVRKEVSGENADENKEFDFVLNVGDITRSFSLRGGEEIKFDGIPVGEEYSVLEKDHSSEGYISLIEKYSGTVADENEIILQFDNIYSPDIKENPGSLRITKNVIGDSVYADKEFEFNIKISSDGFLLDEKIILRAGEIRSFENIPHGAQFTVTETVPEGYTGVISDVSGVIVGEVCVDVSLVNAPEVVPPEIMTEIFVTKKISGEISPEYDGKEFEFTFTANGEITSFTLKNGETKTFVIPAGVIYEVREKDYYHEGFVQKIYGGFGTSTADYIYVTAENTPINKQYITICGEKKWRNIDNYQSAIPSEITLQILTDNIVISEQTVTPGPDGKWKYTFEVPKYDEGGETAYYEIRELPVNCFTASYEGYDVINTYVPPVTFTLPAVTKFTEGENAPDETFEFIFMGQNGSPMPEGSSGKIKKVEITGSGKVETGKITFSEAGEYIYTISESDDGIKGWEYDKRVYTLIVYVSKNDGKLTARSKILCGDSECTEIVFSNRFDEDELEGNVIIKGRKIWDHKDNPQNNRPGSIIVEVYADGILAAQRKIGTADGWEYIFELPKYSEEGDVITYTVDEVDVDDYEKSVDGYNLVNTYSPAPPGDSPPTGDDAKVVLWLLIFALCASGIAMICITSKRKNGRKGA